MIAGKARLDLALNRPNHLYIYMQPRRHLEAFRIASSWLKTG